MEKSFDAVIIGAGLGGLTAGACLAKNGKRVLVLEQHYIPGGCATGFKRKDYLVEVGLHEIDGIPDENDMKFQLFKMLGIADEISFVPAKEFFGLLYGNKEFSFPHGVEQTTRTLIEKFPGDEKGIRKFIKIGLGLLKEIERLPHSKWLQTLLMPVFPLLYPNLVKTANANLGDWLDKNIKSEELKLLLCSNLGYYHDDPYTLSLFYFCVAQMGYIKNGSCFIKGGSQHLSDTLAGVITSNGGQVLTGKKVIEVINENGKATGVSYRDTFNDAIPAARVQAQVVISNIAIPLLQQLLPSAERQLFYNKYGKYTLACSLTSIYIGFNTDLKKWGNKYYSTFIKNENVLSLKELYPNATGDWRSRGFVFVDYSQVDAALCPNGKTLGVITFIDYLKNWEQPNEYEYRQKKEEVTKIFIDRLEEKMPGITAFIDFVEMGTPKTIQRYTLNPSGTPYGFAQLPRQAGKKRPQSKSPVKGLYLTGAWAFPGGGFNPAMMSGYMCSMSLLSKQLKKSSAGDSAMINDERIVPLLQTKTIATNTIELTFKKPEGFVYNAGQYVVLKINEPKYTELDMPIRSLSVVSHPDEATLRFAVRLGASSYKKSLQAMQPGSMATIYGPMGNFKINDLNRPVVFLVAGIGITPVIPLLKELDKQNCQHSIHLFYCNKTLEAAAYHEDILKIKTGITCKNVCTATECRVNIDIVKEYLVDMSKYDFYIVGTSDFLRSMHTMLAGAGVQRNNIFADDFG